MWRNLFASAILSVFAILTQTSAQAQSKFTGYYIQLDGDTVKGTFPGYRQWENNPYKVKFLPSTGGEVTLTIENCKLFHVDSYDTYLSYKGKRMLNPGTNQEISNANEASSQDRYTTVSTFLREFAMSGDVKFYILTDNERTNFFYKKADNPVQELISKVFISNSAMTHIDGYKQQLNILFPEEINKKNLSSELNDLEYSESNLKSFVNKLNSIKERDISEGEGFIVIGGLSTNFFSVTSNGSIVGVTGTAYKTKISPVYGIGYMIPFKRRFSHVFLLPYIKGYSFKNNNSKANLTYAEFNSYIISPSFNIGYKKGNVNTYAFISAGITDLMLLGNELTIIYTTDSKKEMKEKTNTLGLNVLAGVVRKHLLLWGSWMPTSLVTNQVFFKGYHANAQFGVGFKF